MRKMRAEEYSGRSNAVRCKQSTRLAGIIVILSLVFTTCKNFDIPHQPIEIVVNQSQGDVTFEFFTTPRNWWSIRAKKIPHETGHLLVGDLRSVLWEIQARDTKYARNKIKFSEVPEGFEQQAPKDKSISALQAGVEYEVSVHSSGLGRTTFVYLGK